MLTPLIRFTYNEMIHKC